MAPFEVALIVPRQNGKDRSLRRSSCMLSTGIRIVD